MSKRQEQTDQTRSMMVKAYAKVNITLDILGKLADGYHGLATIMQTIDLYDTICLTPTRDGQISILCSRPELSTDQNLALRAAQLLQKEQRVTQGVKIELLKEIPVAAGLGGGSSDAAAVLQALTSLWDLPLTEQQLHPLAASLGADVPFLLRGGLALCEGRGEQVTPLIASPPESMRWFLLLKPDTGVSTSSVFHHLSARDFSNGSNSRAVIKALTEGQEPDPENLYNGLERGVLERYPEIAEARQEMLHAGATLVRLSGSGSTLFAPFAQLDLAVSVQRNLQALGYNVYLTHAITPNYAFL